MDRGSYGAEEYVLVVGGVNIDIGGRPFGRLEPKTSNPGVIGTALGGVGRNIAHNLSLLGKKVVFLTAFGDDLYAGQIEGSCARLGIDISHARIVPGGKTSAYLFLSDEQGDMETAVSDMQICEQITPEYLEENLSLIKNAAVIAADTNIPEESLAYLTGHADVPVFIDPVSVAKAEKLRGILPRIHTLKPNLTEAAALTRVQITGKESSHEAAEKLVETGVKRVFLSMGDKGVLAADSAGLKRYPGARATVRNTTGAGDSFMAGLIYSYMEGFSMEQTCLFASGCAAMTIEAEETINSELSAEAVTEYIRRIEQ